MKLPIPAFIVEGRAEQKIVQKLCPGSKVMILECNGDHVEISAIAKKVSALTRVCGNRHYPVIVQFDREKRKQSVDDIVACLQHELSNLGADVKQFRFGIADRDLESWILYSVDDNGQFDADCAKSVIDQYEGYSGEFILRQRLEKQGTQYHKTTSGVEIFTQISSSALAKKSKSFRDFIAGIGLDCYWLQS